MSLQTAVLQLTALQAEVEEGGGEEEEERGEGRSGRRAQWVESQPECPQTGPGSGGAGEVRAGRGQGAGEVLYTLQVGLFECLFECLFV